MTKDALVATRTGAARKIAAGLGCQLAQRPFKNYADQRNWAIDEFGPRSEWQLHLDADEVLDDTAIGEIRRVLAAPNGASGFIFRRRTYFLGQALRFGGNDNFHLRLFTNHFIPTPAIKPFSMAVPIVDFTV